MMEEGRRVVWVRLPDNCRRCLSDSLLPSPPPRSPIIASNTSHRSEFTTVICYDIIFVLQVLPGYHGDLMRGTLIFIPSYFDFVRVRNLMKRGELSFAAISE